MTMIWTLTPPRIKPFVKVTVILAQGEWSIAKDIGSFFKWCNARQQQTFFNMVNVMSSTLEASVFMGKNYSENLHSIKKQVMISLWNRLMFDISQKLIVGQSGEFFLECHQSTGKILHGNNYLWSMKKKSSVYRVQRFMYSQILCYVLERWTQHQILSGKISWCGFREFIAIQNFRHNWIRMEYFHRIHLRKVQEFMTKMGDPSHFKV